MNKNNNRIAIIINTIQFTLHDDIKFIKYFFLLESIYLKLFIFTFGDEIKFRQYFTGHCTIIT